MTREPAGSGATLSGTAACCLRLYSTYAPPNKTITTTIEIIMYTVVLLSVGGSGTGLGLGFGLGAGPDGGFAGGFPGGFAVAHAP